MQRVKDFEALSSKADAFIILSLKIWRANNLNTGLTKPKNFWMTTGAIIRKGYTLQNGKIIFINYTSDKEKI